jgi:hypothetical protein
MMTIGVDVESLHNNEDRADEEGLYAAAEYFVSDERQGFVDDHVRDEEGDEEEMAILPYGLDLPRVLALLTGVHRSASRSRERIFEEQMKIRTVFRISRGH